MSNWLCWAVWNSNHVFVGNCCLVWSTYTWKVQAWTEWLGETRNKIYCMFLSSLCEVQSRNISYSFLQEVCFEHDLFHPVCLDQGLHCIYVFAIRGTLQFLNALVHCARTAPRIVFNLSGMLLCNLYVPANWLSSVHHVLSLRLLNSLTGFIDKSSPDHWCYLGTLKSNVLHCVCE